MRPPGTTNAKPYDASDGNQPSPRRAAGRRRSSAVEARARDGVRWSDMPQIVTGSDAGLSGTEQFRLALTEIVRLGGAAPMGALYAPVEKVLTSRGLSLSEQGKASLGIFINKVAVEVVYVYPHDRSKPGRRITPDGRAFVEAPQEHERAIDVDTGTETTMERASAFGDAFELHALKLLRAWYPHYAWYHQGRDKRRERGIDFVGDRLGDARNESAHIGVQVSFDKASNAPTNEEWLKFRSRMLRAPPRYCRLRHDRPADRRAAARSAGGQGGRC